MPPPTKYAVPDHNSYITKTHCKRADSLLPKDRRRTVPSDIEDYEKRNKFPAPGAHKLNFSQLKGEKLIGCFKYKEQRSGFLIEAQKKGKRSPDFDKKININFSCVEGKTLTPKYHKLNAEKSKMPEFLNHVTKIATVGVSPTHYKGDVARDYQRGKNDFKILPGKLERFTTQAARLKQWVPPPGSYDIKQINKGYDVTTRGAARGYK